MEPKCTRCEINTVVFAVFSFGEIKTERLKLDLLNVTGQGFNQHRIRKQGSGKQTNKQTANDCFLDATAV